MVKSRHMFGGRVGGDVMGNWLRKCIKQAAKLATSDGECYVGIILITGGVIAPVVILRNEIGLLLSAASGFVGLSLIAHALYRI